jgi:phosphate:Na+ symporter
LTSPGCKKTVTSLFTVSLAEDPSTGTFILLDLLADIALLLWGLRMVRTGVARAFGANLRHVVARGTANRYYSFLAGLGVTAVLQSSTATALIASAFASRGLMPLAAALAIMLGADVGTTLVAQLLSLKISWLSSLFVFVGVVMFLAGKVTRWRDIGRIVIGLGLMLLALRLIFAASEPMRDAVAIHDVLTAISGDTILGILIAALLTWLAHSSLAVVLLVMSLTAVGVVHTPAAFVLVLGANLGGAIPAIVSSLSEGVEARRVTFGNAGFRLVGVLVAAPLVGVIAPYLAMFESDPARQIVDFHMLFNLALAAVFIGLTEPVAVFVARLLPARAATVDDPSRARYLDRSSMESPSVALTCAARETLHMGDIVETMLRQSMTALLTDDRKLVGDVERMDNAVDRLHEAIKLYVTEVTRVNLDETEGRRATDIITFTTNLEHIGDIIDKNLMELAAKKIKHKRRFSEDGAAELTALHRRVLDNLKLALGVFISGDVKIARQLLDEKVAIRDAERAAAESHLARLREGRIESIDTSSLHLDVLRDLKRIHSHICAVAYPILEAAGELAPSRLKSAEPSADTVADVAPRPAA